MSELPAGRELDALVAERVMGMPGGLVRALAMGPQHYSTDIRAAWEVVEKLQADHRATIENGGAGRWDATFWAGDTFHVAVGETAPLAICRAALRAMGAEA